MTGRLSPRQRRAAALIGLCAGLAAAAGCASGDLTIADGQKHRGGISRSVGQVTLGRRCAVTGEIQLKAGNVTVGSRSTVDGQIRIVNGNATLANSARCGKIDVENGSIRIGPGAEVDGSVTLTNGLIEIDGHVSGPVDLVRGRLEARAGSVLAGGLSVESTGHSVGDSSRVVIRSGARVTGQVSARGRVRLIVEAGADTSGVRLSGVAPEPRE